MGAWSVMRISNCAWRLTVSGGLAGAQCIRSSGVRGSASGWRWPQKGALTNTLRCLIPGTALYLSSASFTARIPARSPWLARWGTGNCARCTAWALCWIVPICRCQCQRALISARLIQNTMHVPSMKRILLPLWTAAVKRSRWRSKTGAAITSKPTHLIPRCGWLPGPETRSRLCVLTSPGARIGRTWPGWLTWA